jgi:hypothetical protein
VREEQQIRFPSLLGLFGNLLLVVKSLETDAWVTGAHEVEQFVTVLTDEGLQVVAGDVVPLDSVAVEVVQN